MAVINLKAFINELKAIQRYDLGVDVPSCECCGASITEDKYDGGDWIKAEDLAKILKEYSDDASLT